MERYLRGGTPQLVRAYYQVRPFLPRGVQLALRRAYSKRQRRLSFPSWPIEDVLVRLEHAELRRRLREHNADRLPIIDYWPSGHRFAFVLTHDVESERGIENIGRVREVEERCGLVSSWNFCAEEYPIPDGIFDELRAAGCEIGLHGIDHRGKLFSSRERFDAQLPKIHSYLGAWSAVGFRSPALHRNADWMPELGCLYDSSFPDTDPFEPRPGGCCSIHPFFNRGLVELPVTLAQDHTLFEILGQRTIDLWRTKSEWIIEHGGLINVIVHPDYMIGHDRLALYAELLRFLVAQHGWHALPCDVARWWRTRAGLVCEDRGDGPQISGPGGHEARVAYVMEDRERIVIQR